MHNTTEKYLLQIEPKKQVQSLYIRDELVNKMQCLLDIAEKGDSYKGKHACVCGEHSTNYDIFIGGYITNSLAVHYLKCHREEVPKSEIEKLKNINMEDMVCL